jgi:hypothetical protein
MTTTDDRPADEAQADAPAPPMPMPGLPPTDPPQVQVALHAAMCAVRGVSKGDRNTQQNFNFRGIDAVLNAVGPALRAHGVIPLPKVLEHHTEVYESKGGARMKGVTLMVEYAFVGPAGDRLVVEVPGESADSGDKAYSKAMSVAFRTALIQALALPTDERDPDQDVHERASGGGQSNGQAHGRSGTASVPQQRRAEPEPEPEQDKAALARRAAQMFDQVIKTDSREAAVAMWKSTKKSSFADTDVSALVKDLHPEEQKRLAADGSEPITIQTITARAGAWIKDNGSAVRQQEQLDEPEHPEATPGDAGELQDGHS